MSGVFPSDGRPRALVRRGDEGPARVLRMDPRDGATGVLRDAIVIVRLSHPADPASVTPSSVRVRGPEGMIPGRLRLDPAGIVLMWQPARPLAPGVEHCAETVGLRDRAGRSFDPRASRFVACTLDSDDLTEC